MDLVLLVAPTVLAFVFGLAAIAKLANRRAARQGLIDFGVPAVVAGPGALLLPVAELAAAGALLIPATVWVGAVAAGSLLAAFTGAIVLNLLRGRRPDCRCFGQIASGPIGPATLARNGALLVLAAVIVAQGPERHWPQLTGVIGGLSATPVPPLLAVLVIVAALETWLLVQLVQQNGRLLLRVEALESRLGTAPNAGSAAQPPIVGLPVGTRAPAFRLTGVHGETMTLDALRAAGKPLLLLFTDPECGPCSALLPDLARWQRELVGTLTIAFISRRTRDANRAKATEHGLTNVLVQEKDEVADAFQARGTPAAVLVNADGTIASPVVIGAEAIRGLVARFSGQAQSVNATGDVPAQEPGTRCPNCGQVHAATPAGSGAHVGDPAPQIALSDLSGRRITLSDFKGTEALVLFWNPACGFCQQMVDEWRSWEAARPAGAPQPLIVSTGTPEANRAMDLRSPVVLEPQFSVGYEFGASGTPSAVLINAEGRIASDVAVGASAVMALARQQRTTAE